MIWSCELLNNVEITDNNEMQLENYVTGSEIFSEKLYIIKVHKLTFLYFKFLFY